MAGSSVCGPGNFAPGLGQNGFDKRGRQKALKMLERRG